MEYEKKDSESKKVNAKALDQIVRKFYSVADLAHVEHSNTRSFAQHEALGGFYSTMTSIKDRVIEHILGEGYLSKISVPIIELGGDIIKEADSLAEMFCECAESIDDEALQNISGEVEEAVGKLKFLFRLS